MKNSEMNIFSRYLVSNFTLACIPPVTFLLQNLHCIGLDCNTFCCNHGGSLDSVFRRAQPPVGVRPLQTVGFLHKRRDYFDYNTLIIIIVSILIMVEELNLPWESDICAKYVFVMSCQMSQV